MPLSFEQFKKLRSQGLSIDQIQRFESGEKPVSPAQQEKTERLKVEAETAQKEAGKGLFGRTLKELPGAAVQTFVGGPVKLGTSLGEGIATTFKTGGRENASGKTYDLPGLAPFKSFQSEAKQRAVKGQNPLLNIGQGALETGLAGADTLLLGKFPKAVSSLVSRFDVRMGGSALQKALQKNTATNLNEAIDIVKPQNFTRKEAINLLKTGQVEEKGLLKTIKAKPTVQDMEAAESVTGVVKKSNSFTENLSAVNARISQVSQQELRPFVMANNKPFNLKTITARLNAVEPPKMIKADTTLNNTYSQVKELLLDEIKKHPKTNSGLWDARIAFDKVVEKEFPTLYGTEKYTAVKQAVLDFRHAANDFISVNTPNETFKTGLKKLSNMYTARENIAENSYRLLETNILNRLAKQHPTLRKILGVAGGATIAGGLAKQFGVFD